MPRRALLLITALVLALHWAILLGVPLAWQSPPPPVQGRVFSTRSVAAAPPAVAALPAPAQPGAAQPAAPRPPRAVRRPQPEAATLQSPAPPGQTPQELPPPSQQAPVEPPTPADVAVAPPAVTSPPAAEPASAAAAAPAAQSTTAAGIDITPAGPGVERDGAAPPPAVRIPAPTRLVFDVNGQARQLAYQARAELLWQHDGQRYEARQEISAFLVGSRTQRSTGALTAQGLAPEKFSDKSRSEQAAHFDHARGRVSFSANTPEATVGQGVQDRLSVFIQLGAMMAAAPGAFEPGTHIAVTTVSARAADRWTFTVEGAETLDLPAGPTPSLKLLRLPRKEYDQKAELWVAPDLHYLPVRIRITQANGDFADLLLRSSAAP